MNDKNLMIISLYPFMLPHKESFVFMKKKKKQISRFSCQDTQNGVKRPEKEFRKNVRMDVCACVC